MLAVSAKPLSEGRASKGGFLRALPLVMIAALLVGGAAITAKALYLPVKAEVAQVLLARAFDQSLEQGTPVRPWSWADTAPVSRVRVDRLGVSEIVLSGGSGEAMAFGPTEVLDDRARGVTILAAHRDTHFEFVRDLKAGDTISLDRIDGTSVTYRVRGFETVRFDEFTYPAHGGSGLLALTTCWPFGSQVSGPMRRVAWAEKLG
ncbi:MAG: class GN sortase [Erythrobacteraceae bacterium]|nr:class GN sortase [Erythrobacteraceae bacterium]